MLGGLSEEYQIKRLHTKKKSSSSKKEFTGLFLKKLMQFLIKPSKKKL